MNLITRLRSLEARIYSADAHEAPKYVAQMQEELYEAWPKLAEAVHALNWILETDPIKNGIGVEYANAESFARRTLAALENPERDN